MRPGKAGKPRATSARQRRKQKVRVLLPSVAVEPDGTRIRALKCFSWSQALSRRKIWKLPRPGVTNRRTAG